MLFDELPAVVGLAIASPAGRVESFGTWESGVAWSTIKVPLAVAALRDDADAPVASAIVRSDNAAAEELWARLGDHAAHRVQDVIRDAGDSTTVVESRRLRAEYTPFGQSQWPLADQARFAVGLSRMTDAWRVVELMGNLCPEHRWGLAAAGFPAKGGWGPGSGDDYLVRQFAIVPTASGAVGVALAAEGDGYESGVEVLNRLTQWVVHRISAAP